MTLRNMFATNNIGVFRTLSNFYNGAFSLKYFRSHNFSEFHKGKLMYFV